MTLLNLKKTYSFINHLYHLLFGPCSPVGTQSHFMIQRLIMLIDLFPLQLGNII